MTHQLAEAVRIAAQLTGLSPEEREAGLRDYCRGDVALERVVRRSLALHDADPDFLNTPVEFVTVQQEPGYAQGSRIGPYELVRLIDSGSMADVYEARHPAGAPNSGTVALKLARPGILIEKIAARIGHEIETLAGLHHPNIVAYVGHGAHQTAEGLRPYFAMEFVQGVALTTYANEHTLDILAKLELVEQLCSAMAYAHLKGVIHCDLKPFNILVNKAGRVKVLDFGIARTLSFEEWMTTQSDASKVIGTIPYMSPEQIKGRPDTRSDVYSLGVLIYELISGHLPHAPNENGNIPELIRAICEDVPEPLAKFVPAARGDLARIAAKTLDKDPERRYQSVSSLMEDVRRARRGEPLPPPEPQLLYDLRRLARRHRVPMIAALAVLLAVVAGTGIALWQAVRATRAELLAERMEAQVRGVGNSLLRDLLNGVFNISNPTQMRRLMAERAVAAFDELHPERGENSELMAEQALALLLAGAAAGNPGTANTGDLVTAHRLNERAIRLLNRALELEPGAPHLLSYLSRVFKQQAFISGSNAEALMWARRAEAAINLAVEAEPTSVDHREGWAYSLVLIGMWEEDTAAGLGKLHDAIEITKGITALKPAGPREHLAISVAHRYVAERLIDADLETAEREVFEARQALAAAVAEGESSDTADFHSAILYLMQAKCRARLGATIAEVRALADRGLRITADRLSTDPTDSILNVLASEGEAWYGDVLLEMSAREDVDLAARRQLCEEGAKRIRRAMVLRTEVREQDSPADNSRARMSWMRGGLDRAEQVRAALGAEGGAVMPPR